MSDHERLVSVAQRWERLYRDMCAQWKVEADQADRLCALVSWIDGRLVDEAPHMEIRAGIDRWREGQK